MSAISGVLALEKRGDETRTTGRPQGKKKRAEEKMKSSEASSMT